ncbi:hypothetical protein T03_12396, partial [Trichinella britovi]
LVLILEDNIPRAQCPIGVITELHLGSDGIARSARIRTSTNVITRPVAKLVQLEPATVSDGRETPPSGGEDVADRNGTEVRRRRNLWENWRGYFRSVVFIDFLSDYPRLSVISLIGLSNSLDTPGLTITTHIYSPLISETSDSLFRSLHSGPPSRIGGIIK